MYRNNNPGCATVILALLIVIVFAALSALIPAGICYLIWTHVVMSIWPTAVAITFWQMYWVYCGLSIIGGLFKTRVTKE